LTVLAVVATGNHWWFDGIVAVWLIGLAIVVERSIYAITWDLRSRVTRSLPHVEREVAHQPSS
jgi:hypothetical protein